MKNLRYVVRDPRSTVRAPPVGVCAGFKNVCSFQNAFCAHTILNEIIHLTQCVLCVQCVQAFSSSFSHVHALLILSSKSNFDSKKGAQCAQIALALATVAFQQFQKVHRYAHRPCTDPLLSAQIPKSTTNRPGHRPRTTTQAYRFALHAHRSVFLMN